MSNKLYTEEQVRKAIRVTFGSSLIRTENDIISLLNHIELPTDEEIEQIASDYLSNSKFCDIETFEDGAKFAIKLMRYKIQGGNNEQ